jgi:hypothetical protein
VIRKKRARKAGRPSVQPRPTSAILGHTFRWLKLDDEARSYAAMRAFATAAIAAGPQVAQNARAERLRGSILYVRCTSSSWMQHLHLMKALLLQYMRAAPGGGEVHDIRCNVGALDDVPAWERPAAPVAAEDPFVHEPPADVMRALDGVVDDELRQRLAGLYGKLGSRGKRK